MKRVNDPRSLGWILSRPAWIYLWLPILLITILHYGTAPSISWLHDIYRRLYYLPIIAGGFIFGLKGSLGAAVVTSLVYLPHAFSHLLHHDPAPPTEKFLEILLYNVVGAVVGVLADREHRERRRQEEIARQLAEALEEMKIMEEQLIRSGKLQALGELTAGLAHEIKNPLASLKGAAEIISDEIPPQSPRRRMVEILIKEISRLNQILDRFLSFARPRPLSPSLVSASTVIEEVLELMEPQARKSGVALVQGSCQGHIVRVDKNQLAQVLMNLILNAIQAVSPAGEVRVSCRKVQRGKRAYCLIDVEDTGPGLPEEVIDRIFNPFFTTRDKGSGLGLSIAARLVEEMGGLIEVHNRPEGGASFHVCLPLDL